MNENALKYYHNDGTEVNYGWLGVDVLVHIGFDTPLKRKLEVVKKVV